MSLEQNFPQVGGPVLDPRGNFTDEWLSFFRSLWNRTGQGPGSDPSDAAFLGLLDVSGDGKANAALTEAQTAQLLALAHSTAPGGDCSKCEAFALSLGRAALKDDLDDAKLFALSLSRPAAPAGSSLKVDDEGAPVDTAVTELNFTGAGVTATQTSPGVVQVDVPGASMSSYVPVATGSEPLTFMSNGSGQPMLIPYTP